MVEKDWCSPEIRAQIEKFNAKKLGSGRPSEIVIPGQQRHSGKIIGDVETSVKVKGLRFEPDENDPDARNGEVKVIKSK